MSAAMMSTVISNVATVDSVKLQHKHELCDHNNTHSGHQKGKPYCQM